MKTVVVLLLWSLAAGCGRPQPQPPPPPPPAPAPPPPPPAQPPSPPPAPDPTLSCHSLTEKCVSIAETKLAVGHDAASFHPPDGWTYAHDGDVSLAVAPHAKAVLGFSVVVGEDRAARMATLTKLLSRLAIDGVSQKKLRDRLKKPQHQLEAASGRVQLWEVDKKSQRGKAVQLRGQGNGTLLIVMAAIGGKRIVGCGFVVKPEAQAEAAAIMQSVQSLEARPAAEPGVRMEEI